MLHCRKRLELLHRSMYIFFQETGRRSDIQRIFQMTKTPDFTKTMQDMMASMPVDTAAFQNAFKTHAAFGEKFAKVALEAAEKSTEITSKWAKEALGKMGDVSKAKT
jgi:hypothetical protein